MATPPPKTFVQDLPRKGGFPTVSYRKVRAGRGPPSWFLLTGATALTLFGWYRLYNDNNERNYKQIVRLTDRIDRAALLQAKEDVRWEREHQRLLDEERELFANDPNWVVGRNVYHTMPQPKSLEPWMDNRMTKRM